MTIQVTVPDVGDASEVEVIEILVAVGDTVAKEDSLVVLESDKASMEIPSPYAGKVSSIAVKIGDTVGEGSLILELEGDDDTADSSGSENASCTLPLSSVLTTGKGRKALLKKVSSFTLMEISPVWVRNTFPFTPIKSPISSSFLNKEL